MAKTIYLHIGTHKTGSTSIQGFLARAEEALARQGIIYPKSGRPDTNWSDQYGQHELYWFLSDKRGVTTNQAWRDLQRELDQCDGDTVVISAEGFATCSSEQINEIVAYLRPHSLQAVVYLRSPLDYLRSMYKQLVKGRRDPGRFRTFVKRWSCRVDYRKLVSRWEEASGIEAVNLKLFDKVIRDQGLESSFAEAVGIDFEKVRSFTRPPSNVSPSDLSTQVGRRINMIAPNARTDTLWDTLLNRARRNVLGDRWPGRWLTRIITPLVDESLISEEARSVLRTEIGQRHERFLKSRVNRADREYLEL